MRVPGRRTRAEERTHVDDRVRGELLLDSLADAVVVVDADAGIVAMNPAARRMFGIGDDASVDLEQLVPPAARAHHRHDVESFQRGDSGSPTMKHCVTGRRFDGSEFPAQITLSRWTPADGAPLTVATVRDMSEWQRLERHDSHLAALLAGILESSDAETAVVDEYLMVVAANGAFRQAFLDGADPTGMSLAEIAGLVSAQPMLDVLDAVRNTVESDEEIRLFCCDRTAEGDRWLDVTTTPLRIQPGAVVRAVDITTWVHAARRSRVDRSQDPLTGLMTRASIEEGLRVELRRANPIPMCVLMVDIDQFAVVRQTLGYGVGDELLREVATIVRRYQPAGARVARMGDDTFCVVWRPDDDLDVDAVSSTLRDAVRQPLGVHGRTIRVTASVGTTRVAGGTAVDAAVQQAEIAMQEARRRGGNRCVPYARELAESQEDVLRLWNALRSALQFRQMEVWFQPIVSLVDDRPIAIEALCRWHHPQFGDVSPGQFIPIAERNSEILNIGSFVQGRSAEAINALRHSSVTRLDSFQVSVNASPNEIAWPKFAANFLARLKANEALPEWFAVEVTEGGLLQDDDAVRDNLHQLADAGVVLTLDDFGTGRSSIEQLLNFPITRVKIDRKFVAGMMDDERNDRLVSAMLTMAADLGIDVVAEGVETSAQARRLRELGCHSAQGFLFAPAVPEGELVAVLNDLTSLALARAR